MVKLTVTEEIMFIIGSYAESYITEDLAEEIADQIRDDVLIPWMKGFVA